MATDQFILDTHTIIKVKKCDCMLYVAVWVARSSFAGAHTAGPFAKSP